MITKSVIFNINPKPVWRMVMLVVGAAALFAQPQQSSWRTQPQHEKPASDDVPPAVRKARDLYFDSEIGSGYPLDEPPPAGARRHSSAFVHEQLGAAPEIPASTSDYVAIVTFSNFQVHLSQSKRSVYTELTLNVETLLKSPNGVSSPESFTVILPGGKLAMGPIEISQGELNDPFTLQPQHRYVVFLNQSPVGGFDLVNKTWELRDGKVFPLSPDDRRRASNGSSQWTGKPEAEFLAAVRAAIANR